MTCFKGRDEMKKAMLSELASILTIGEYRKLTQVFADICRRNGKRRLVWITDREKALSYEVRPDEMLLTVHRWFAKKSCSGNWLFGKLGDLT